mmetsp:Transcript_49481/g.115732  ORF Transcript_49481/g.115732 Transcript_49481/m.115732 type:complete len:197 (-) Transcript_49481:50-640(-)
MGSIQCCCCESDGLSMSDVATPLAVEEDHRVMKKPVTVEVEGETFDETCVIPKAEPALATPREPIPDLPEPESAPPPKEDTGSYVVAAPPTPEPTMEPAANEPFLVIVQNKQGVRLGFGVGHVTGQDALYVVSVGDEGSIPEWNKLNPDRLVASGCSILEINDTKVLSKSEDEMLQEISAAVKQPELKLLLKPPTK